MKDINFEVCDSCFECYWYDRDDANNCDGEKEKCSDFIFNEES